MRGRERVVGSGVVERGVPGVGIVVVVEGERRLVWAARGVVWIYGELPRPRVGGVVVWNRFDVSLAIVEGSFCSVTFNEEA